MRNEKAIFVFACSKCNRRHYSLTNMLAPFVQREHRMRYFCEGKLVYKSSERADTDAPRYVS